MIEVVGVRDIEDKDISKLSRAERRRLGREGKKKATYCYTQEQINSMIKEAVLKERQSLVTEVTNVVLDQYLVLTMGVLYDKFDFDKDQLLHFKKKLEDLSDLINEDYCTVEDYKMILKDELGIVFHNSSYGDSEQPEMAESKADEYKNSIIEDSKLFMLIVALTVLREEFGFAAKRGTKFVEGVIKYAEIFKSISSEEFTIALRNLCNHKLFGEAISVYNSKVIKMLSESGGSDAEK